LKVKGIRKEALKIVSFRITYVCEQTSFLTKYNKSPLQLMLMDQPLWDILKMAMTQFDPDISQMASGKRCSISH
jgi:hypothetical protein